MPDGTMVSTTYKHVFPARVDAQKESEYHVGKNPETNRMFVRILGDRRFVRYPSAKEIVECLVLLDPTEIAAAMTEAAKDRISREAIIRNVPELMRQLSQGAIAAAFLPETE